jgi:hypothetical protein
MKVRDWPYLGGLSRLFLRAIRRSYLYRQWDLAEIQMRGLSMLGNWAKISASAARAPLIEPQKFRFGYGRDALDGLQDGVEYFAVQADEGDCLRAAGSFPAAQGESGDIHAILA